MLLICHKFTVLAGWLPVETAISALAHESNHRWIPRHQLQAH